MIAPRLQARGIDKRFPGVLALSSVDFTLHEGEVLAVVGENGAGKSTLMKILAGVESPSRGEVLVDGKPVRFRSVAEAQASGIALIHQELCLCDRLSVAANICLGRETKRWGVLDHEGDRERAQRALDRLGVDIHPGTAVEELSIGHQQMVEIAKAVDAEARVLIMDEPTSSLSLAESELLFELIEELAAQGTSIVYISHRLSEVERLAHRALVLRDGELAGELEGADIHHARLVELMVGRDVSQFFARATDFQPNSGTEVLLRLDGVRTTAFPQHDLTLEVHSGEVVGIAGLVGAGRSDLMRALFLVEPPLEGQIHVGAHTLDLGAGPGEALASGLAFVPEDRKKEGLFLDASVRRNLSIARLHSDAHLGLVNRSAEARLVREAVAQTGIKARSADAAVAQLSGGNQQKVVLGRAFATAPRVLCLDEPTRGVDVGAKAEIYQLLDAHAQAGGGVLFVSSEMEEILGLSDRCLVMHEGRIAGELTRSDLTEEAVMSLATGGMA